MPRVTAGGPNGRLWPQPCRELLSGWRISYPGDNLPSLHLASPPIGLAPEGRYLSGQLGIAHGQETGAARGEALIPPARQNC
jgi:hypothetical protein